MVNFKGASNKDIAMMAVIPDKHVFERQTKQGVIPMQYMDISALQIPGVNENLPRQSHGQSHLYSKQREDGTYTNAVAYTPSQVESIMKAAGDNVQDLTTKDGEVYGKIAVFKADVTALHHVEKDDKGNVVKNADGKVSYTKNVRSIIATNPQPMPDDFVMPEDIRGAQFAALAENKAQFEAQQEQQQAEQQAEAPAAESDKGLDEPDF